MADQPSNSGTSLDHDTDWFDIFDALSNDEVSVAEFDDCLRKFETKTGVEQPYSMEDVVEQWDHILETLPEHNFELTEVLSYTNVTTTSDPWVNTTRSRSPPRMPAHQKLDSVCKNQSNFLEDGFVSREEQEFWIKRCQEDGDRDSPLLSDDPCTEEMFWLPPPPQFQEGSSCKRLVAEKTSNFHPRLAEWKRNMNMQDKPE
ncbi:unnamed protein product [Orchesella dallaii]|uniref:Uncharacterized protein n=1 Tax=Orchesella dallaii TaxID=48710 RepID=A0ABP1QNG6_9HEXA